MRLTRRACLAGAAALGLLGPRAARAGRRTPDLAERARHLADRAMAEEGSSAILIQIGDEIVEERYADVRARQPLMAMSVSKSITALAIGELVARERLALDRPLSEDHVPEWAGTDKADITLRHLLTHTSGLDPTRYGSSGEELRQRRIEDHLAVITRAPDSGFVYNNTAVNLLSVICRRAHPGGLPLDDQLRLGLFGALDVAGAVWMKDGRGDPRAAGGLLIRPRDLLRIGAFVRDGGVWAGERLLPESWMTAMLSPSSLPGHGWLWWLDRPIPGAPVASWRADGYLGQMLIIVPALDAVVVRMRDPETTSWSPDERSYPTLPAEVLAWLGSADAPR